MATLAVNGKRRYCKIISKNNKKCCELGAKVFCKQISHYPIIMECQKCKKQLSKKGSHFLCQGTCQGTFHRNCVKGLAADIKAGRNRRYCNNCEEEESDEEEPEDESNDFTTILKDIQKKVGAITGIQKNLDTIKLSISVLSDKYDTLITDQGQAKERITKLEKISTTLNNKFVYLEKCNLALEQRIDDFEQSTRHLNMEIVGIDYVPGENLREIVEKIGEQIGASCQDIEWVKRSRPPKQGMKPPTIIIGFKTSGVESRSAWLEKRRQLYEKSITSNQIVTGSSMNYKIYFNEHLVPSAKTLLWNAKKQLNGIYKYIWVNNGKILVKKGDDDRAIVLKSLGELQELTKPKETK